MGYHDAIPWPKLVGIIADSRHHTGNFVTQYRRGLKLVLEELG